MDDHTKFKVYINLMWICALLTFNSILFFYEEPGDPLNIPIFLISSFLTVVFFIQMVATKQKLRDSAKELYKQHVKIQDDLSKRLKNPYYDLERPYVIDTEKGEERIQRLHKGLIEEFGSSEGIEEYNAPNHRFYIAVTKAIKKVDRYLKRYPDLSLKRQLELADMRATESKCPHCNTYLFLFREFLVYCVNCEKFVSKLGTHRRKKSTKKRWINEF